MKHVVLTLSVLLVTTISACSADSGPTKSTTSKTQAAAQGGVTSSGDDLCDVYDWYGDGECDGFCPLPDVDCGCSADGDCGEGLTCDNGSCSSAGAACAGDSDCSPGYRCNMESVCEPEPEPGPACQTDDDCPPRESCQGGACEPVRLECTADVDCPVDQYCSPDGTCVLAEGPPPECAADDDCPAGEACTDGACFPVAAECSTDDDCPVDHFCSAGGECLPIEQAPPECQEDLDCVDGEVCRDQFCVVPNPSDFCETSADCAQDEACDDAQRCVAICGGFAGYRCEAGNYCDYPDDQAACGAADGLGFCRPVPDVCSSLFDPVCGCDGQDHSNACEAHRAGTDDAFSGGCSP